VTASGRDRRIRVDSPCNLRRESNNRQLPGTQLFIDRLRWSGKTAAEISAFNLIQHMLDRPFQIVLITPILFYVTERGIWRSVEPSQSSPYGRWDHLTGIIFITSHSFLWGLVMRSKELLISFHISASETDSIFIWQAWQYLPGHLEVIQFRIPLWRSTVPLAVDL